jgi:serine phosphatase RsbU (regulator of sigma subunit)/pSer/pThr/pTyr-binding forkhead associated (FHA) protein
MDVPTLSYADTDGQHTVKLETAATTLGRSPGQNIILLDPFVSRQHAVIVVEGSTYTVMDRDSSHGTFLNGERVLKAVLKSGDVLQLGSLEAPRLNFVFDGVGEQKPATATSMVTSLLSSITEFPAQGEKRPTAAREMEQLNWLLSAARQLNAGGAIEDILTTLLQLTLQLTSVERGFVFLSKDGEMKLARGLNSDGHIVEEDSTISHRAIQKAIESDAKFSISDTMSDSSGASAWASVMVNKIRSIYCIPLRKRDSKNQKAELLGLLYLDSQIGAGKLSEVDQQLLDTIATEAAALLQNALLAEAEYKSRRTREELAIASKIHNGLMSITLPEVPYALLQAKSISCYEIGGDFYDALALDDCVCVALADVSGKGVPAAIVAAIMQGIIHAQLLSGQSLPDIAALLNQFLCTRNVGKYATMVLLKLFPDGRVEYMNCGHIQPLLIHNGKVSRLEESNLIVGLLPGATYSSTNYTMKPGERILLATDGLVEAENNDGEPFGDTRLSEVVVKKDLNGILEDVGKFQANNEAQDDCTVVEVQYSGGSESSVHKTG